VAVPVPLRDRTVRANDLEFGLLEAGSGPLALCLHGFPDTAHTWEHLLPALAGAGFAAAYAPDRWRRVVTLAVPPAALDPVLFSDYEQLKRLWYMFVFRDPRGQAEAVVARDDMSFLDKLWRDWSPGFPAAAHLARVKESLRQPGNLAAAIGYYRAAGVPLASRPSAAAATRYAGEQQAAGRQAPQPGHRVVSGRTCRWRPG
jgi:hypothetical protein